PPPRWRATTTWAQVGSTPTTDGAPTRPTPTPAPRHPPPPTPAPRAAPASSSAANGRICSSSSASAPSVKPACHHPACCSQRSSPTASSVLMREECRICPKPASERRGAAIAVDLGVDGLGHGVGEPRQLLQLLEARLP